MTHYVCKICGRGLLTEQEPKVCYYDGVNEIEALSDLDARKMQLFEGSFVFGNHSWFPEFPGDVVYNPITAELEEGWSGLMLSDYQRNIMKEVVK